MPTFEPERKEGYVNLSQNELQRAFVRNKTLTGYVTKIDEKNKKLIVNLSNNHTAILPFDEATIYDFTYKDCYSIPVQIFSLRNKPIQVKIIDIQSPLEIIYVSRRENMQAAHNAFYNLSEGSLVRARVILVKNDIAFVDMGAGVIGTITISSPYVTNRKKLYEGNIVIAKKIGFKDPYFTLSL